MRANRYWEKEETVLCRLCEREKETWEHVWEDCREWMVEKKSWQEVVSWILGEEGEGEWWMREVEEERGRGEEIKKREGQEKEGTIVD